MTENRKEKQEAKNKNAGKSMVNKIRRLWYIKKNTMKNGVKQ